jgi:hypothetical protein
MGSPGNVRSAAFPREGLGWCGREHSIAKSRVSLMLPAPVDLSRGDAGSSPFQGREIPHFAPPFAGAP